MHGKLREEVREKLEEEGCIVDSQYLQEVIEDCKINSSFPVPSYISNVESLYRKKFDFSKLFPDDDYFSSKGNMYRGLNRMLFRAIRYETEASRYERLLQEIASKPERYKGHNYEEELFDDEILNAQNDGSKSKFRETKIGRVGAKIKEIVRGY